MSERVTILGATGSVGRSTIDVLLQHPERFQVSAIVAGRNAAELADIARRLKVRFAALADPEQHQALKDALAGTGIASGAGPAAVLEAVAHEAETVVAAIAGVAGLPPTHAALQPGRRIALANKESLVCAGGAFMRDAARIGATILPMDSEHNALHQAVGRGSLADVVGMTITASGGPFRNWTRERMAGATPADTAKHPTYSMGDKINVDSASLMNKGLELIEAHHLFGLRADQLDAVVHPQQVVHGLVYWRDGSVTAGLARTDMRIPIADCLAGEGRISLAGPRLDLAAIGSFTFEAPDEERFPCFRLAREALAQGGAMPAILNGANEVAVASFLAGRIGFLEIAHVVDATCTALANRPNRAPDSVEDALAVDAEARRVAAAVIARAATTSVPAAAGGGA